MQINSRRGRLLSVSPSGIEQRAHVEDDGCTLYTQEYQPTSLENAVLDNCARLRGMAHRKGTGLQFAGQVPLVTWQMWKNEFRRETYDQTMTWGQFLAMKLNSSDYKLLRVQDKML